MVVFPNAKINIGLNVLGKRNDGFHDIETVFYPIPVKDVLEIIPSYDPSDKEIIFTTSGNEINVNDENNLCLKAYHLIKKNFPQIPSIKMHLHKHIPAGAGLGGGSSDASAVLLLLNKQFDLNIPESNLLSYALELGSDCPFFILNKPSFATGRGENLSSIDIDLSSYKILVINPGIHVNTGEAFNDLNTNNLIRQGKLMQNINTKISEWKNLIKNDFEESVFKKNLAIQEIKNKLYECGAIYSSMSGTGSTVFGIFSHSSEPEKIKFPSHFFCQVV